jgi:hypothetical protein
MLDTQRQIVDGHERAEHLGDIAELDARHRFG